MISAADFTALVACLAVLILTWGPLCRPCQHTRWNWNHCCKGCGITRFEYVSRKLSGPRKGPN